MENIDNNQKVMAVLENVNKVIVGKQEAATLVLTALLSGGHVLLEDVPGMGKTMMAKAFAMSIDADFKRIQFTPDLLPSDVTGINYYNQKEQEFVFRKGPVFTNILLGDEINRATPRTQSALLECMEEKQVTVDTYTYELDKPFMVLATQNPVETAGTYQLPEAQLDRFLMKINMGYPSEEQEIEIMTRYLSSSPLSVLKPVCSKQDICNMQNEIKNVYVHKAIMAYIAAIARKTREYTNVSIGVSPRATIAMLSAARAYAFIQGRSYVVPDDIKYLAGPVFAHRLILKHSVSTDSNTSEIIRMIVNSVDVPTEDWNK